LDYQYDVFLSYRASNAWPQYVRAHFQPMLEHWLAASLGRQSQIFYDVNEVDPGRSWPRELANGIAHSRTMVCLWSREYFTSKWCLAELDHMNERRRSLNGSADPLPLILGVVIHDGDAVDGDLRVADIQRFDMKDCNNPWMAEGSEMKAQLSLKVRDFAEYVARAVKQVPNYNPTWETQARQMFEATYNSPDDPPVAPYDPPGLG
jgi:hypothetical protein